MGKPNLRTRTLWLLVMLWAVSSIPILVPVLAGSALVKEHLTAFFTLVGVCTVALIWIFALLVLNEKKRRGE